MAIVPNLNGVPISPTTPLSDPHNYSKFELAFMSDGIKSQSKFTLAVGLNTVLAANALRNTVTIVNPENNSDVAGGITSLTSVDDGVPLYAGNGFTWKGQSATRAVYVYSSEMQDITVMVG